ncbi:MAG: alpha/beta fold hydrolase [Steroidobacteraceae bacterium]
MTQPVGREFISLPQSRFGPRQVHMRRAGRGPAVLLLHQSPLSSRDVLPMLGRLSATRSCIAPDTPGYGLSDPLPAGVDMEGLAAAVIELADTLGLEQFALYGFHTGAMIALAVALHHPERVTVVTANGCLALTAHARADMLARYLPAFSPSWDGAHLTWLWARLREQTIFFPWYRGEAECRMAYDVPSPAHLQAAALEFLRAGDHYRSAYRAALAFDSPDALRRLTVPALVTASSRDPLSDDLTRLPTNTAMVSVVPGGSPDETLAICERFLADRPSSVPHGLTATRPLRDRPWQALHGSPGQQLRCRWLGSPTDPVTLILHDAWSCSDQAVNSLASACPAGQTLLACDLPGHGESDPIASHEVSRIEQHAGAVSTLLDRLDIRTCRVVGFGYGGLVGIELALRDVRVASLASLELAVNRGDARWDPTAWMNDLAPRWHGGHLLAAWHMMRDSALFQPWFERTQTGIITGSGAPDPEEINQRVLSLLRSPHATADAWRAHLDYPLNERLAGLRCPHLAASTRTEITDWLRDTA